MRAAALLVCSVVTTACASSGALPPASTAAPVAVIPRWAEPASSLTAPAGGVASRAVLSPVAARETVHIAAPAERDPVDALVASRHGRRRLRSFTLRDAPVGETLRMFAELGDFNVVVTDEVGDRRVTLTLRDVSLLAAFRAVLSAAHLGAEVVGGEVVEVRPASSAAM